MIKFVVCDVDGTILKTGEQHLSDNVSFALDQLSESGRTLCFASGRSIFAIKSILGKHCDNAYLVGCDGAVIAKDEKVLYTRPISSGDVLKLVRDDKYRDCAATVSTPYKTYVLRGREIIEKNSEGIHADNLVGAATLYDVKEPVVKVSFFSEKGNIEPVFFGIAALRVCYNANGWCEYVSAIADKGLAVSDLQMRQYLSKFDTACFGDGENDVCMMKKAKYAVSVGNASEKLKEVCNFHTEDIAKTLNMLCKTGEIY